MNKFQQITSLAILSCALLSGCAKSIKVDPSFPQPLVEKLPLTVGVVLDPKLIEYVHIEDPMLEPEWTIDIGQATATMFRTLFTGMFRETYELARSEDGSLIIPPDTQLDAIIKPSLEDFEFASPNQSGTDQYTIWIRYKLSITTQTGETISDWRVTAYGQVDKGAFGMGAENAMNKAAIIALRDAAANIATSFSSEPGVKRELLKPEKMLFQDTAS